jgi:hypothetical protein
MARFTQYPVATDPTDYTDATNFLIESPDGSIKLANMADLKSAYFCDTGCASLTIASADVLQLNTTPLTIVAAQGAGTAIEVISASMKMVYNSVAYATATTLALNVATAGAYQLEWTSATLASTLDRFSRGGIISVAGEAYVENQPLTVTVDTADPTAGDSDITVYVYYRVITV